MSHTKPRKPTASPPDADAATRPAPRLQKALAAAGLGSRRACEELILAGRVEVDRRVVSRLGTRVDPRQQEIRVDGVALPRTKLVYYVLNKPAGVVCTHRDPAGRPRAVDMVPARDQRLFSVGRLDMSSEGLLLLTNDGELANLLAHPRYGVEKTYVVEVAGSIERDDLDRLRKGVHLAEGRAHVVTARVKSRHAHSTLLEVVLDEGRNREIRRMLARSGHKVLRLRRIALGPLRLGELPTGHFRPLEHGELRALRDLTGPPGKKHRPAKKARPSARRDDRPRRTIIGAETKSHAQQQPQRRQKRRPFKR